MFLTLSLVAGSTLGNIIFANGDGGNNPVSVPIIFGVVVAFLVIIAGLYLWNKKKESTLKKAITQLEKELSLLQSYGEKGQELIGNEMMTFRENFARHRETNKGYETDGTRDFDKFLISASHVKPVEQIGKGR